MTDKHTPGPWETDHETEDQSVLGPDGFMVADCAIFSLMKGAPTEDRCRANARLIAAAPDLRTMLETMIRYAEWQIREGADHHPTLPSAVDAARAAIAKAEGRS